MSAISKGADLLDSSVGETVFTTGDQLKDSEDYSLNASFWEKGQALGFPIQFDLVLRHLRQDMRDDWYFDCLQYEDLFNDPSEAKRIIISLLQNWNGS